MFAQVYSLAYTAGHNQHPSHTASSVQTLLASSGHPYSYYFEPLNDDGAHAQSLGAQTMIRSASLLKLPHVMDIYYASEAGEINLDQTVTIPPEWINKDFGNLWQQGAGSQITLREASHLALVDSDNTAINIIKYYLVQNFKGDEVMRKLGLSVAVDNQGSAYTEASSYSKILRCLYLSCYLNSADSQIILDDLAQTRFAGIKDGVPADIQVADKIGESSNTYADCGIVYYPNYPYILCLMVGDINPSSLGLFKQVSRLTYLQVDRLH